MATQQNRRSAIKSILAGTAAIGASGALTSFANTPKQQMTIDKLKGNINHSVCRWCYAAIPLDDLCDSAKEIGIKAIDLVGPADWPTLQKHGLYSAMCNGAEINLTDGFGDKIYHEQLIKSYSEMIPKVADAGYKMGVSEICYTLFRGKLTTLFAGKEMHPML